MFTSGEGRVEALRPPAVSFGVPTRNGARFLPRLFDSLLAQDSDDFEVVVGDNGSTDDTQAICEAYAARDHRIRYVRHAADRGLVANFNFVRDASRGRYFRWIGDDDWVEPGYVRICAAYLDRRPDRIAVTTEQDHVYDDGTVHFAPYRGERLESPEAHVRFRRMLRFLTSDFGYIDPMYTLYRREAFAATRGLLLMPWQDHVLAAELSLVGPWGHVPELLAHRRRHMFHAIDKAALKKHYEPKNTKKISGRYDVGVAVAMWQAVLPKVTLPWQRASCLAALLRYESIIFGTHLVEDARARVALRSRLRALARVPTRRAA